jgi:hypothetical protein
MHGDGYEDIVGLSGLDKHQIGLWIWRRVQIGIRRRAGPVEHAQQLLESW